MCMLFDKYENEIKSYCSANSLSFAKAKKMSQCWGKNDLWLQFHDPKKGRDGLKNETPAPVVLKMSVRDGVLHFEQTEHTKKYLAQ